MKNSINTQQSTKFKGAAILVAVVMAVAPFGGTALAFDGSAYGQGAAQGQGDPLATCPNAARSLVESYQGGGMTAEALADGLRILAGEGALSSAELDGLLALLDGGALDPLPDVGDEGDDGSGEAGVPGEGSGDGPDDDAVVPPAPSDPGDSDAGSPGDNSSDNEGAQPDGGADETPAGDADGGAGVAPGEPAGDVPAGPSGSADAPSADAAAPSEAYPSSGTYTPHHYSHDLTTEKFIAVIGEQARQIGQERDLYASVMIAQAILESASGNSKLARSPYNNLFGIKGSWEGESVAMPTMEDDGSGLYYTTIARFRSYDSIMSSLEDYADLLTDDMADFYRGVWKPNAETPVQACDYLEGRYATSTSYSESLQDLIATYDLTRFDDPLDYEPVETYEAPVVDEQTGEAVVDEAGEPVMEQRTLADLLAEATSHLGAEYVWGAADVAVGFDCSGLVQYSYQEALGIELPRTTQVQWKEGETVDFNDLHMGDLLFFERDGDVYHVALYLGDGFYIHAPQQGDVVKVTSMEELAPSFARRIVETRPVEEDGQEQEPVEQPQTPSKPQPVDYEELRLCMNFLGL